MTDQQLKQAQELKRNISLLEGELEKCGKHLPAQGINVFLPNVGTLIERVKIDLQRQLDMFNRQFKEL